MELVRKRPIPTNNHEPFRWNLLVRATHNALPDYVSWGVGKAMPEDSWLVAEHLPRNGPTPGPYYFAHKTAKGWQFGAATRDGWLIATSNACILCHSEALADHVFGLSPISTDALQTQRPDGG